MGILQDVLIMLEAFLIEFLISIIVVSCKGYIDTVYIIRTVIGHSQEQGLYRDYFHH